MALSGTHVTAAYAGPLYNRSFVAPILGKVIWSETMASAGTTALGAPPAREGAGMPIFRVQSSSDIFVAIGAAPNASSGPRTFVRAGEEFDFYAEPNDKLAWIAA